MPLSTKQAVKNVEKGTHGLRSPNPLASKEGGALLCPPEEAAAPGHYGLRVGVRTPGQS